MSSDSGRSMCSPFATLISKYSVSNSHQHGNVSSSGE